MKVDFPSASRRRYPSVAAHCRNAVALNPASGMIRLSTDAMIATPGRSYPSVLYSPHTSRGIESPEKSNLLSFSAIVP